jgi:hypothetical protein
MTALLNRSAAESAVRNLGRQIEMPMVGTVAIPPPDKLAYYAGIGALALFQVIEWPLALVITAGHLLADQHVSKLARGLGGALESA